MYLPKPSCEWAFVIRLYIVCFYFAKAALGLISFFDEHFEFATWRELLEISRYFA